MIESLAVSGRNTTFVGRMTDKMTLKGFLCSIALVALVGCSSELSREQRRVRRAAEQCYEYLQKGKYEKFVGEIAYADQMSSEYRSQMVDLVHEHMAGNITKHGRMLSATAIGETLTGTTAQVFLQVTYADSTSEEIGVPMVLVDDEWMMQ